MASSETHVFKDLTPTRIEYGILQSVRCRVVAFLFVSLAVSVLTGCPDVGLADSCVCVESLNQNGWPTAGGAIEPIQPVGMWSMLLGPGSIGKIEVDGGNDWDVVYDKVVEPLDGCAGGCGPSQYCLDNWGNANRACMVLVGNVNSPYTFLTWGGYLEAVEPDLTMAPLYPLWHMEAKASYISDFADFSLTANRSGASQSEIFGPNFAEREFAGLVLPSPRYTMSIVTNAGTAALLLSGPDRIGSEDLRRNFAENPNAGPQDYLYQRIIELSDNSVHVDYRVASQDISILAPVNFDKSNALHMGILNYLDTLCYDIMIVDHYYDELDPPPPAGEEFNGILGVTFLDKDFMILAAREILGAAADVKRVFFHEIGHCVGLGHDQPLIPGNLMRTFYEDGGMDVHVQFNQSILLGQGSPDWND